MTDTPGAAAEVPVQLVDAGDPVGVPPASDRGILLALERRMEAVRSAATADDVLVALVDLVGGLVESDAVTVELRGPASAAPPRVVVHRGLTTSEATVEAYSAWVTEGLRRFGHRLTVGIIGADGSDAAAGELSLWRVDQEFDGADRELAQLAATSVAVLVHQFLRRTKGEQRNAWRDAAEEVAQAILSQRSTTAVLQVTVDRVRAVSECDLVWLVTGTVTEPVVQVVSGLSPADLVALRACRLGPSLTTEALAAGGPVRVAHLGPAGPLGRAAGSLLPAGLGPALAQPILVDDQVVGTLGLAWFAGRTPDFLSLDPGLPAQFAQGAALVLRVRRARADAERVAVLEERDRIRLDLHDRVIQRLYALGMALDISRLDKDPDQVDRVMDLAVGRIDEAIGEIRRTITGLGVVDDGMDLYDAMVDIVDKVADSVPFRPELRVTGLSQAAVVAPLSDDVLSVLEEALSNVVRHARATRCRVTLDVDDRVTLVVDDDGVGVPQGVVGSGLDNIRRRATANDGDLTMATLAPGTRLTWSAPLPVPSAATPTGSAS